MIATDVINSKLISEEEIKNLKTFKHKLDGLIKMISRDRMKVVFFGRYRKIFYDIFNLILHIDFIFTRTSNGKSTVINSMLREKILPTGIGHTTHCFLQVEGCESSENPCIFTPGSETSQTLKVNK